MEEMSFRGCSVKPIRSRERASKVELRAMGDDSFNGWKNGANNYWFQIFFLQTHDEVPQKGSVVQWFIHFNGKYTLPVVYVLGFCVSITLQIGQLWKLEASFSDGRHIAPSSAWNMKGGTLQCGHWWFLEFQSLYPKNPGLSWDILRMGLEPWIPLRRKGFGFSGIVDYGHLDWSSQQLELYRFS